MDTIKGIGKFVWGFLTSKDMKALYWLTGTQLLASAGDLIIQQFTAWDPNNIITLIVGLIISRITKKLNKNV